MTPNSDTDCGPDSDPDGDCINHLLADADPRRCYILPVEKLFHPLVREWFERRFGTPTQAQALGWPAIARGRHTLISAPTGSGKTLAAFLICLDRLIKAALDGTLEDVAQAVYVSPLKALSNDVHTNLQVPLVEIRDLARQKQIELPEIRIALRTGDTPAHERQARARKPPHIWITTPESLYILLTSASGRRGLSGVCTLILDEIHAVAGGKRGSHLSLSVERLCALAGSPVTRIGLSATQRPIEEVARFLVGTENLDPDGRPSCEVVDIGYGREMDLKVEIPGGELGPVATNVVWDETVARIAELGSAHRTTLVFMNTRRLVERVAHQLSAMMGEDNVAPHHGSLSRQTRLRVERRLKHGELKVCVATASLELGIDIGAIDLVCQVGTPRSIGILLQRVGRSGHRLGAVTRGRLFPLTRDELIESAALLYAIRQGELDRLGVPSWPLDILAQQIVAMCSAEAWQTDDLFRLVRRSYPYRQLPRKSFDDVVRMLSVGLAGRLGYRSAFLHLDGIHNVVRGRRNARIAALTSGGAIPDSADYDVILEPDGTRVGTVFEDFAVESMTGDVFLLGNSAWRIRKIERGRVLVEDARGQAPNVPFWIGEAPARTRELSACVSTVRQAIADRLHDRDDCIRWLAENAGLSEQAAAAAWAYVSEGKRVLGAVPTDRRVVAERFFDESGGMQLVLHAPFGSRINRAWGLALRKRFCRKFDFELQASATDDGINLSLGAQHSFPLEDVFQFLRSHQVEETLAQAVLASPVFTVRWRWTLARALALLRFAGGRRVPPQIQRMRADDLLAAVFPAQAGCQDNRAAPDIEIPEHPLVSEALRDCLHEALDADGLREVLRSLERGEIELLARDTPMPSIFSHQILNAMPYAFLDGAPIEERRARAVFMRRVLPEQGSDLGSLSPDAIRGASEDAWPEVRDAEELHDALLGLTIFPESQLHRLQREAGSWFESLVETGRAVRLERERTSYWIAAERADLVAGIPDDTEAVTGAVRGWIEVSGPLTAEGLGETLGLETDAVRIALARLEAEGLVLRGRFTPNGGEEFCDRRILARIHRATLVRLRREIEPVPPSTFLRFLFEWQHVSHETPLEGESGVLEAIEQLQGFETAAAAWEAELLPVRVHGYKPTSLDSLCLAGEVIWGRWTRRTTQSEVPARRPGLTRTAVLGLALRENVGWLLDPVPADESALSVPAGNVLAFLRRRGASFFAEIVTGTHHLPSEVEDALWQLVAAGLVTADSFAALRALVTGEARRLERSRHRRRPTRRTREGRWSLLEPEGPAPDDLAELRTRQLLRRYGVLCRELLAREISSPPWRDMLFVLRRLESRGEIRGGRFVAGLAGEQFALPEAVDALRAIRRREPTGLYARVSACDPLNLAGIVTPGPRVPAVLGNRVVYRDGIPVASVEAAEARILMEVPLHEARTLERLLDARPASAFDRAT
jgi:ATP-dependent Lhr-like helicase